MINQGISTPSGLSHHALVQVQSSTFFLTTFSFFFSFYLDYFCSLSPCTPSLFRKLQTAQGGGNENTLVAVACVLTVKQKVEGKSSAGGLIPCTCTEEVGIKGQLSRSQMLCQPQLQESLCCWGCGGQREGTKCLSSHLCSSPLFHLFCSVPLPHTPKTLALLKGFTSSFLGNQTCK